MHLKSHCLGAQEQQAVHIQMLPAIKELGDQYKNLF